MKLPPSGPQRSVLPFEWLRASEESLPFDSGTFNVALAVTIFRFLREPRQVTKWNKDTNSAPVVQYGKQK